MKSAKKEITFGPKTGAELAEIGVHSPADLQRLGWEEVLIQLVERFPERANLNMAYGLIGVMEGVDWREISPVAKAQAQELVKELKQQRRRNRF